MQRSLVNMMRFIPLRVMYGFASVFVLPVWMLLKRQPVKDISLYFNRRYGLKGCALWKAVWLNHYRMMQIVIDKFAAYGGHKFRFTLEGNEAFKELEALDDGFIILSSHIGNSELVGFSLGSSVKRISALVYGGESQTVMENRRRLLAMHNIDMIAVDSSLNHIFEINAALAAGNIVGMPADRIVGSQKTFDAVFLGAPAAFPLGAFATAIQRNVNTVAIFMMKDGVNHYRLIVRPVTLDEKQRQSLNRRERMVALGLNFVSALDEVVKRYPHQWFNYYDFWNEASTTNVQQ